MEHGPPAELEQDNAAEAKSRLGLILFAVYSIIYAGFVLINTLLPKAMGMPILGVNLAVVYGVGLIVLAIVMGLIYNAICTRYERELNTSPEDDRA